MSTEWEYEEANDQEKLQIAQHFLVSTPPGQVHDVMRDLKKLVPSHVLTESVLRGAMHAFNLRNTLPVLVPESNYQVSSTADK
jgi:capping protein alpha